MNVYLLAAGVLCFALAVGHTVIGAIWVLTRLSTDSLPRTPFGGGAMTSVFIKVTWHVVGITLVSLGGLLVLFAGTALDHAEALAVRGIGLTFATMTVTILWLERHRPTTLIRAPMWVLFVAVAALCWWGTSAGGISR
jgi:hypothetical protein